MADLGIGVLVGGVGRKVFDDGVEGEVLKNTPEWLL